jgi:hypothetical protein
MKRSKWKTTFQVSIPDILEPQRFQLGRKKFLERLRREIEPAQKELGFPVSALEPEMK